MARKTLKCLLKNSLLKETQNENMTLAYQDLLNNVEKSHSSNFVEKIRTTFCVENGSSYWKEFGNYTSCTNSTDNSLEELSRSWPMKEIIRHTLFIGSIFSLLFLIIAIFIFIHFKSIHSHRITILKNFMVALAIKSCVFILISDPTSFSDKFYYRDVDWVCKLVVLAQLYSYLTSVNWMLIQGHFLNSKLSTDIFQQRSKLKFYYVFGWGAPMILIMVWLVVMETFFNYPCWKHYSQSNIIWIIVAPMFVALLINIFFFFNIIHILLKRSKAVTKNSAGMEQLGRVSRATVYLFPLLGLNNFVFFYNPGGSWVLYYMMTNAILQPLQGIAVSILYCFVSQEVRECMRREYKKILDRRCLNVRRLIPSFTANITSPSVPRVRPQHIQIENIEECDFV